MTGDAGPGEIRDIKTVYETRVRKKRDVNRRWPREGGRS